ncbi:MAG: class B sortase [Eubacteriales bacterium]|nr:class B sortase [Eubacteriales bacterium]
MIKKIIISILVMLLAFIAIFSGIRVFRELKENKESADTYTDLENYVSIPRVTPESEPTDTNQSESGETQVPSNDPKIDFDALLAINPDCVGWIYIPDTDISYPVVQGDDNSYYLKHLFDGKWNSSGCIFMDSRVDASLSDRHTIIYGHHMKNGKMFSGLTKYKKQEYFECHPTGLFITPDTVYRIDFFAGYVAGVKEDAWKLGFQSDDDFESWIKEIKEKSWIESDLSPAVTDRVLTLSTCSYEFDNARFVLIGVIRD